MILQIMVYAAAVAAALGVVGLCLERLATLQGLPRRTAWIVALLLSVLLPLIMILRAEPANFLPITPPAAMRDLPAVAAPSATPGTHDGSVAAPQVAKAVEPPVREWRFPWPSDRFLAWSWGLASSLLGFYLIGAQLLLRRRMASWQSATVLEHPVLVSERVGPALVGVMRPRIVIPQWLLDEPVATRSLILQHEQQHIAARDPLLIRAGMLLLVALPWNLPLWWQWRRLRQAVELDCDARVLRAGAEPETYGEVLLAVTGRAASIPIGTVAMSEPVSALERRIQNLLPDPIRHAALQAMAVLTVAALGMGVAVAMNAPVIPVRAPEATLTGLPMQSTTAPLPTPPAAPTAAHPLMAAAAETAAPPAAGGARAQPSPTAPATAAPTNVDVSPRDKALRAAVLQYPELINGPALPGYYSVTIVMRADGTVFRSSLRAPRQADAPATYGSGAMAGVVNRVLNRRLSGFSLESYVEPLEQRIQSIFDTENDGPQTTKILQGQQIADVGKASNDILAIWRVLPTNYDESRYSRRVADAVRAKRDDLLSASRSPRPDINLLTVFMTEDGQIAREAGELLDNTQYLSLRPQAVNGESDFDARSEPYNSYNPPPVPAEAFKILGLDAGQIGQTGLVIVGPDITELDRLRSMPPAERRELVLPQPVLVFYAWPRRPGEPIGGRQ